MRYWQTPDIVEVSPSTNPTADKEIRQALAELIVLAQSYECAFPEPTGPITILGDINGVPVKACADSKVHSLFRAYSVACEGPPGFCIGPYVPGFDNI